VIALILAAGLGTRLKPWTLSHPKALVPVAGVPMLKRVINTLASQDFDTIIINVHHFAEQIVDYVKSNDFGVKILISDESSQLLDTGGGLVKAASIDDVAEKPILVHNVDILSNANLKELMKVAEADDSDGTLLVSPRDSSRKLIFDNDMYLRGWHNVLTGELRPASIDGLIKDAPISENPDLKEFSFSGIYVMKPDALSHMRRIYANQSFPIMDFFLNPDSGVKLRGVVSYDLSIIDIGKPDTLALASKLLNSKL